MNAQTKISARGQIVIPKSVRDRLHWSEGDRLIVIPTADGVVLRRSVAPAKPMTIDEFMARMPAHEGSPATLKEMNDAIERARTERWAAKEARSR